MTFMQYSFECQALFATMVTMIVILMGCWGAYRIQGVRNRRYEARLRLARAMQDCGLVLGPRETIQQGQDRLVDAVRQNVRNAPARQYRIDAAAKVAGILVGQPPVATWEDESGVVHVRSPRVLSDEVHETCVGACSTACGATVRVHDTEPAPEFDPFEEEP